MLGTAFVVHGIGDDDVGRFNFVCTGFRLFLVVLVERLIDLMRSKPQGSKTYRPRTQETMIIGGKEIVLGKRH